MWDELELNYQLADDSGTIILLSLEDYGGHSPILTIFTQLMHGSEDFIEADRVDVNAEQLELLGSTLFEWANRLRQHHSQIYTNHLFGE